MTLPRESSAAADEDVSSPRPVRRAPWRTVDAVHVAAVAVFSLLVRLLSLLPADIGGDAVEKWHFVKQWHHAFSFEDVTWDHHRARFGVNVVVYIGQLLFGDGPVSYFVTPVLASTVAAVFTWLVARDLMGGTSTGRLVGVVAALAYIVFPRTAFAGSQILPEVFAAAYVCAAAWMVLRYAEAPRARSPWLWGSIVFSLVAYSAKETSVFFIPGLCLATVLLGRLRDGVLFAGAAVLGFALECAFFASVSPYWNRIDLVSAYHRADHPRQEFVRHVTEFVTRYGKLDGLWQAILLAFVAVLVALFLRRRNVSLRPQQAIALVPASFLFCFTFMVRSLDPITLWVRTLDRYLDAVAPLFFVVIAVFAAEELRRLVGSRPLFRSGRWRIAASALVASLALLALGEAFSSTSFKRHPILEARRAERVLSDAYGRGLPFAFENDRRGKVRRGAFSLYVDSALLVRDGALTPFEELGLDARPADKTTSKGCQVTLRSRRSRVVFSPRKPLPARCIARAATPD